MSESTTSTVSDTDDPLGEATGVFVEHRELFGLVYNMLGSVADTEDVLQETWLSWTGRAGRSPLDGIANPRAYLVRVAVNHALARRAAGLRPVHGRDKAVRLISGYASRGRRARRQLDLRYRRVNGDDAAVLFEGDSPYAVMVMDLTPEGDQVSGVYIVSNPDKLTHVHREEQ
ncbi:hypothetical protein CLM62_42700 [Streptomyces sp. SA15]|uniref:sigma factor n=1 Tax=Streptomyces sp. SA15 TaxID=934019 RepID=UPI000BB091AE|nr:sigma factor [Streptomyces sp. SA15]PAZ10159.1 hypothetical protein CLM62_42700 [Streptomyces sp. SA15]